MNDDDVGENEVIEAAASVSDAERKYKWWKAAALTTWGLAVYNIYSLQFLITAAYLWIGYEVVENSREYTRSDIQYYLAAVAWLPLLVLGGLKRVISRVA